MRYPKFEVPLAVRNAQRMQAKFGKPLVQMPAKAATLNFATPPRFVRVDGCSCDMCRRNAPMKVAVDYAAPEVRKRSVFSNARDYMDRLERMGYTRIGSGAYSAVYQHDKSPDRVIKISRRDGSRDDWPLYVKWVNNIKSPFGIRVYNIKDHKSFYVAIMEHVETIASSVAYDDPRKDIISNLRYRDFKMTPAKSMDEAANLAKLKYAEDRIPGIVPFVRLLKKAGMLNDLHDGNYGFRKDGSLVIFDPVVEVSNNNVRSRYSNTKYKRAA